jgi:hypothetical protein
MDIYSLERMVLDAVVITQSSTAVSVVSEAEVRRGFDIMMEREFSLGQGRREIWEAMKQRVSATGKLQFSPQGSGIKRKHDQLESPVITTGSDKTSIKKVEGAVSKHAKTSKHPVIGIRYRPGKMLLTPPIRTTEPEYERFRGIESSYIPDTGARGAGNEQVRNPTFEDKHEGADANRTIDYYTVPSAFPFSTIQTPYWNLR